MLEEVLALSNDTVRTLSGYQYDDTQRERTLDWVELVVGTGFDQARRKRLCCKIRRVPLVVLQKRVVQGAKGGL